MGVGQSRVEQQSQRSDDDIAHAQMEKKAAEAGRVQTQFKDDADHEHAQEAVGVARYAGELNDLWGQRESGQTQYGDQHVGPDGEGGKQRAEKGRLHVTGGARVEPGGQRESQPRAHDCVARVEKADREKTFRRKKLLDVGHGEQTDAEPREVEHGEHPVAIGPVARHHPARRDGGEVAQNAEEEYEQELRVHRNTVQVGQQRAGQRDQHDDSGEDGEVVGMQFAYFFKKIAQNDNQYERKGLGKGIRHGMNPALVRTSSGVNGRPGMCRNRENNDGT